MLGGWTEITGIFQSTQVSVLNLSLVPSSAVTGLSWIYLSFYTGEESLPDSVDVTIPFAFINEKSTGNSGLRRKLLQSQDSSTAISVWPSSGRMSGETLVTVCLGSSHLNYAGFSALPKAEDLQIIACCTSSSNANSCMSQASSNLDCIQQIPLTNIEVQNQLICAQYTTLPSIQTGQYIHMMIFLGNRNLTLAPRWNFNYISNNVATIDRIVPSYSSIQGGVVVRIFVSELSLEMIDSTAVKVGVAYVPIIRSLPWNIINGTVLYIQAPSQSAGYVNITVSFSGVEIAAPFQYTSPSWLKILSITPSRGPVDGGFSVVVLLSKNSEFTAYNNTYHSSVDGVFCPVVFLEIEQGTGYADNDLQHISVQIPPHAAGSATLAVLSGEMLHYPVSLASVQIWFDAPLSSFRVTNSWTLIDDEFDYVLLALEMQNCPSSSELDYFVSIQGLFCDPLRIDILSVMECVLFVSLPDAIPLGDTSATIQAFDAAGNSYSTQTVLEVPRNASNAAAVKMSLPSYGPTEGTNTVQIFVTGMPLFPAKQDVLVYFGVNSGTVQDIIIDGQVTELVVTAPPYPCITDSCSVTAEIVCTSCPEDYYLTFQYIYTVMRPRVKSVSRTSVPSEPGISIAVYIENFPSVNSNEDVYVSWGGSSNMNPSQVLISSTLLCGLLITTPETLPSNISLGGQTLTVLITPLVDGYKSVAFEITLDGLGPSLLSFSPSLGPSSGGFVVDVVMNHFPYIPNENYMDSSGIIPAVVTFDGSTVAPLSLTNQFNNLDQREYSCSQISFMVPFDDLRQPGTKWVDISALTKADSLIAFPITLYDPQQIAIISAYPTMGFSGVSGTIVTVDVGNLWNDDANMNDIAIITGNIRSDILAVSLYGFRTQIVFRVPDFLSTGLVNITVLNTLSTSTFPFFVLPSCDASSDSLPFYFSWFAFEAFGESLCVDARSATSFPLVDLVNPLESSCLGGSMVKLISSGFWAGNISYSGGGGKLETSDILVFIGDYISKVISFEVDGNVLTINLETPASNMPGAVQGRVLLPRFSDNPAEFLLTYYEEPSFPPAIISITPSAGSVGSNASVIVQVCVSRIG